MSAPQAAKSRAGQGAQVVVPARQTASWIIAGLLTVVVVGLAGLVAMGGGVQWAEIPNYIFDPSILAGVQLTLVFTFASMALAILGGGVLAVMRLSRNPVLVAFSQLYVWFFRGTPLLVQIIFWFNIPLFIPHVAIGALHLDMNAIISP